MAIGGGVVERVAKLNAKLLASEGSGGGDAVLESLRQLQGVRMTFEALEATKVGRAVNALRKSAPSEQARQLAAELYRRWKALADEHFVATRRARAAGAAPKVVEGSVTCPSSSPIEAKKKEQPAGAAAANGSSAVEAAMPPAIVKKQRSIRLVIKNSRPPSGGSNQQSSAATPAMASHLQGPAAVAKRVSPATSAASLAKAKPPPPTALPKPSGSGACKRKEAPPSGGSKQQSSAASPATASHQQGSQRVSPVTNAASFAKVTKPPTTAPPKPIGSGGCKRKEAPAAALDEARLARAKMRLHEGYKEASTAKEKRKIQVIAAPGKRRQR